MTILYLVVIGLSVGSLLIFVISGLGFKAAVRREVKELIRLSKDSERRTVTESDLESLPAVVQRYLRYTGTLGRDRARVMRIQQRGSLRLAPRAGWRSFTAEQYYSTDPVAFVWSARVKLGPFTLLRAMDSYRRGKGRMVGKLMSTIPVVEGRGKEMDQGSLLRFLNEMMWFPSVYLSDAIRWEGIDDRTARATIKDGHIEATATIHFDEEGKLVDFEAPRYRSTDTGFEMTPWSTPISGYRTFDGMRLPGEGPGVWKLDDDDFTYIEIELTEVEVNPL